MTDLAVQDTSIEALNSLIMGGDMSGLNQKQKLDYYHKVCAEAGLNPYTRPFDYMELNGKHVLYANKGAAEQLRNIHGISIISMKQEIVGDIMIVTVEGRNKDGRTDVEMGFSPITEPDRIKGGPWKEARNGKKYQDWIDNPKAGQKLTGDAFGNAVLKANTKAKRRLTLSMAGLGMLDETEVDSIPTAIKINDITEHGEVVDPIPKALGVVPFKIQVVLTNKGEPDWKKWARDFYAHIKNAIDDDIEEWIDLNQDAYGNLPEEYTDIHEKLAKLIDSRIARVLDNNALS